MNSAQAIAKIFPVSTQLLFVKTLELLKPDVICDIGSRNGNEALVFRSVAPQAKVIAFEANPELVKKMQESRELRKAEVEILHYAVSDAEATATFSVMDTEIGNGSLKQWVEHETRQTFTVPTTRLDNVLGKYAGKKIALWVDAEGCGYEVLKGAEGLLHSVQSVHVEVETIEHWRGQKIYTDIIEFMERNGFFIAHMDIVQPQGQGDIVFVNKSSGLGEAKLGAQIVRMSAFENLGRVAYKMNLRNRMPKAYDFAKNTLGAFLRNKGNG